MAATYDLSDLAWSTNDLFVAPDGHGYVDLYQASATGMEGAIGLVGAEAATDWLPPEISRDQHGFVLTGTDAMKAGQWNADREPFALETSALGIFAVGDIRSESVKRVAASVGEAA